MTTSLAPKTIDPTHEEILYMLDNEDEHDMLCIVFEGNHLKILLKDIDSLMEYDITMPICQVVDLAKKFTLKLIQD